MGVTLNSYMVFVGTQGTVCLQIPRLNKYLATEIERGFSDVLAFYSFRGTALEWNCKKAVVVESMDDIISEMSKIGCDAYLRSVKEELQVEMFERRYVVGHPIGIYTSYTGWVNTQNQPHGVGLSRQSDGYKRVGLFQDGELAVGKESRPGNSKYTRYVGGISSDDQIPVEDDVYDLSEWGSIGHNSRVISVTTFLSCSDEEKYTHLWGDSMKGFSHDELDEIGESMFEGIYLNGNKDNKIDTIRAALSQRMYNDNMDKRYSEK